MEIDIVITKVYVRGVEPPLAIRIGSLVTLVAAILNLVAIIGAAVPLYRDAGAGPTRGLFILLVLGVALYCSAPVTCALLALRGHGWTRYWMGGLTVVSLLTTRVEAPLAIASSALMVTTTVLFFLRGTAGFFRKVESLERRASLRGRRSKREVDAYVWAAFFGLLGAHLFYLRRSWQGVLYVVIVGLLLTCAPFGIGILLLILLAASVGNDMTKFGDFVRHAEANQ
jgi:TM2 domain-containing membrane protein YozV